MKPLRRLILLSMGLVALSGCASNTPLDPQPPAPRATPERPAAEAAGSSVKLEGTSWRLVQISMSDGVTRPAIERSRYTIGFGESEVLHVRFDCNRGRGSWKSSGPGQLEFGPLALTRAMCAPGSLHDQLVRQWPYVRSYLLKDGRLFLSLMADGGTIEFEPAP
jgi:para-nitrobenzyl esterase